MQTSNIPFRSIALSGVLVLATLVLAPPSSAAPAAVPGLAAGAERSDALVDPSVLRLTTDDEPAAGALVTYDVAVDNTTGSPITNARLDTYLRTRITTFVPTDDDCDPVVGGPAPVGGADTENTFLQIQLGTIDVGASVRCSITVRYADPLGSIYFDEFDRGTDNWTIANTPGTTADPDIPPGWFENNQGGRAFSGSSAARHEFTLDESFPVSTSTKFQFQNAYKLEENRDGGVVEGSIDDGATWIDLGPYVENTFFGFAYNGLIDSGSDNPLAGRPVYTGSSPATLFSTANLGDFAGENMRIRFVLGTDGQNDRPPGSRLPGEWIISGVHAYNGEVNHMFYFDLFSDQTTPGLNSYFANLNFDLIPPEISEFLEPTPPGRFLDTRSPNGEGGGTLDDMSVDLGKLAPGTVTQVPIVGRGQVPLDAGAVAVNFTAIGTDAVGYITVYPCTDDVPNTASLNYSSGVTLGNEIIAELSGKGALCIFNSTQIHLVADVSGYVPAGSPLVSVSPARIVDTRPAGTTIDGRHEGDGRASSGQEFRVDVAGRAGIPQSATAIVVNPVAINPSGTGFLTMHPCLSERPLSSNLNYSASITRGNEFIAELSDDGDVCVYASTDTHISLDVTGYILPTDSIGSVTPARVLDTRPNGSTIDDRFVGLGRRAADSVTRVSVGGRAGVPSDASAVLLNLAAVTPETGGFVTVFTCGLAPRTSNLNHLVGVNSANDIVAPLNRSGELCLYTSGSTHLVADVVGFIR